MFKPREGYSAQEHPCGSCLDCLYKESRDYETMMLLEGITQTRNNVVGLHQGQDVFITLTLDDLHIPEHGHLDHDLVARFFKTLKQRQRRERKKYGLTKEQIRMIYSICGEYGDTYGRPHWHGIVYNLWMPDFRIEGQDANGIPLLKSNMVENAWNKGIIQMKHNDPRAIKYVSKHNQNQSGEDCKAKVRQTWWAKKERQRLLYNETFGTDHQKVAFDLVTHEPWPVNIQEPYMKHSRPAPGWTFYEQFRSDFDKGFIVIDGKPRPIPHQYLRKDKERDPMGHYTRVEDWKTRARKYTQEELDKIEQDMIRRAEFFKRYNVPGKLR